MNYLPLLRVCSAYDFLTSNITLENYFLFLKKHQIKKASLVTTNSLFGVQDFYQKAIQNKIKPIIGLTLNNFKHEGKKSFITLFPKNFAGYQNLISISSQTMSVDDHSFLLKKNFAIFSNLIVIIHLENNEILKSSVSLFEYLQKNNVTSFFGITETFTNVSQFVGHKFYDFFLPFDAVRYFSSEESKIYEILNAIKDKKIISQYKKNNLHFKSLNELNLKYLDINLINKIDLIFQKIDLIFPKKENWNLKKFPFPPTFKNSYQFLKFLCQERLKKLQIQNPIYYERLNYELEIIYKKRLISYFLIVHDYVQFALKENILVGPGRGSCAGSLVAYLLEITKVDPIKYDLIFERFLNPKRDKLPDIDLDFEDNQRNKIWKYLVQKHGKENVAQIATFQKIAFKMAIRDVGRVLNIPLPEINEISKEINLKHNYNFKLALKNNLFLQASQKKYSELFFFAEKIIGLPRQLGVHAAGIVITEESLIKSVALWRDKENNTILQTEMVNLNFLNLIKMDLLGLKNLTIIGSVLKFINPKVNKNYFLSKLDLNDQKTFNNLQKGDTFGIFQLESEGMTSLLKKIQPTNINEIALTISLFRPGPLSNLEELLKRKEKSNNKSFLLNIFDKVLHSTYGVPIYQEQIIQMLYLFADFSFGDGETLREAMSKKNKELIYSLQSVFYKKAFLKNYSESLISKVWKIIFQFAGYGFNRSHAISYSFIVYWMSYLKTNYFDEFMLSLMNDTMNDLNKIQKYLFLWRNKKTKLNFIFSANHSCYFFEKKENNIFLPFGIIKYIGKIIQDKIIQERLKNGLFKNILDFFARMTLQNIKEKTFLQLIHAGVLDEFKHNRNTLIFNLKKFILFANFVVIKDQKIDWNLFSLLERRPKIIPQTENITQNIVQELLALDFIYSYSWLKKFRKTNKTFNQKSNSYFLLVDLKKIVKNRFFSAFVIVEKISSFITKKSSKKIFFLNVSDETSKIRIGVWDELFEENNFEVGKMYLLEIKVKFFSSFKTNANYSQKQFYLQKVLATKKIEKR